MVDYSVQLVANLGANFYVFHSNLDANFYVFLIKFGANFYGLLLYLRYKKNITI